MRQSKKRIIFLILLFFLSIKIIHLLNQKGMFWDSAVYIGMGKYIFSLGKVGLWEPARPLVWPILLGILWKAKLNPIILGRILELLLSMGCIYLTYLIGKDIFNENTALLSAFFLAFTPTFLFHSSTLLTGIPSLFFALLATYFLFKKRYFLTGLFIGLSFMTRFLQLFIIIPFIIFLISKKKKNIINLTLGFTIPMIPYLILNLFIYKNPLHPFILQSFMTKYTGWIFHQPLQFYFINLLKENFLFLFSIIGAIAILKQKDYRKITILSIFLLFFIFFNLIVHKEMRFILTFLPYMCLVTSHGIFKVMKKKKIVIVLGVIWLVLVVNQIKVPNYEEYREFRDYLGNDDVKTNIWISNPIFIVNTNKKADELIYYPLYNSKKIDQLKNNLNKAGHILINTCDILPCPPEDTYCPEKTSAFISHLKDNFRTIYHKKENNCEEFIFSL